MDDNLINLNMPTNPDAIIKVIGVGGGGGNAVMSHLLYVIRINKH